MSDEYEEPYEVVKTPEAEYWMSGCQSCNKGKLLRISRVVFNESRRMMQTYWCWKCKNPQCGYEVR